MQHRNQASRAVGVSLPNFANELNRLVAAAVAALVMPRVPSPEALPAEIDIANTMLARGWHALQVPMVDQDDRALAIALRNSIRCNTWRMKAGLTLRPNPGLADWWRSACDLRFSLAAWRRNHRHSKPITTPRDAA